MLCSMAFEKKYRLYWIRKSRFTSYGIRDTMIIEDTMSMLDLLNHSIGSIRYTDPVIYDLTTSEEVDKIVENWRNCVDKF